MTTTMLMRWPDAAPLLRFETRKVLDLIVAGKLDAVRLPDDLYVSREQVETLRARDV
jgi:hypothetical protein